MGREVKLMDPKKRPVLIATEFLLPLLLFALAISGLNAFA